MFETKNLSKEKIEQRRNEKISLKRANRRRTIKKSCCKECGEPKHYICLKHHPNQRNKGFRKLWKKIRYNSKKLYFNLAKTLNLIE